MDRSRASRRVARNVLRQVFLELQLVGDYMLDVDDFQPVCLGKKFRNRTLSGFSRPVDHDIECFREFWLSGQIFPRFQNKVSLILLIFKQEHPSSKLCGKLGLPIDEPVPRKFNRIHHCPW
jgi:hypothetical protein